MDNEESHQDLLTHLADDADGSRVYVVGTTDTGKTTLCQRMAERMTGRYLTAYVDGDPGQSVVGPPTTVGLRITPARGQATMLRFIGSTSPVAHLLQTLTGVRRLSDMARTAGAQRIMFDTCGLVQGQLAEALHFQAVDLLQPNHIVALQTADELEPILSEFRRRRALQIHCLPVSTAVLIRTAAQRREYRRRRFGQYFESAVTQSLDLRDLGLHGMMPDPWRAHCCRGRLIALCDDQAFVITLGIVETIDFQGGRLRVLALPFEAERVASIQLGSIYLNRSGEQLAGPVGETEASP